MKTHLLKVVRGAIRILTISVITIAFLMAFLRATAPAVSSEMPAVTRFLSKAVGKPVQIQSLELRWRRFLPVLDLHQVVISGDTPCNIGEIKLGWHFILLKDFTIDASSQHFFSTDSSSYFKHIVLENAVITYKPYKFTLTHLSLYKKNSTVWAWKGRGLYIDLGKLFLAPLFLNSTSGHVQYSSENGVWNIAVSDLTAINRDAMVLGKFSLSGQPKSSPVIDLAAHYEVYPDAVKDLKNYLPMTIIEPSLFTWLNQSIKSIAAGNGKLLLKGSLSDFPYDKKSGQFLVDADINNAELRYFAGWPVVKNINAELIFSNASMMIHVHSAQTAHTFVQDVDVSIPVLDKNQVLSVVGKVSTDVENSLYFIQHSPLQATLGQRFSGMEWTGPLTLGINIAIPFSRKLTNTVKGTIGLNNTSLSFPAWKVNLKNFTGLINFTEKAFSSPGLSATYNQAPVTITIDKNSAYHIQYKKYKADISSGSQGGWLAKITAPEWRGLFTVPQNVKQNGIKGTLYYLNADHLSLDSAEDKIMPSALPPLNIQIQNLRYKKLRFDYVSFITQPMSSGLFARSVQINGPGYSIVGQGKWFDNQQSWLNGKLTTNDIAKMLTSWGLTPSIQGNSGQLSFSVEWPGQLYSPNLKGLEGTVIVGIGKGQLITTGSQAKMDFGRLLTMLSFESLARRLSLDFSDLTQKGLAFDSIQGTVLFNGKGTATIKHVILNSAVATVDLFGDIYLLSESYGLSANVKPHLTSSLPIIAALTGGPVVGAAVWAASKVVDPLLGNVTEDKYSVTGLWKNPTIKKG